MTRKSTKKNGSTRMSPVQYTNAANRCLDVTPTLLVQGVGSSHGNRAAIPLTLEPEAPAQALEIKNKGIDPKASERPTNTTTSPRR